MPGDCFLDRYDSWNDIVGQQFLELCWADPTCGQKMSTIANDPNQSLEVVFNRVESGQLPTGCNEFFTREELRNTLARMLDDWSQRILIPPLLYRLNRCTASDREVISLFLQITQPPATDKHLLNSPMLCDLITLSELFSGSTSAELRTFLQNAYFSEDVSLRFAEINEAGIWHTYRDNVYAQQLPHTSMPMLMLNGTTDPQTPLEIAGKMKTHFVRDNQHFVTVPYSTHGVLVNSPISIPPWKRYHGPGQPEQTCGSLLLGQFINDPGGALDTSCLQTVYPVEFGSDTLNNILISQDYFGTKDMWEGWIDTP